jgi:hypothetical protein
LEELKSSIGEDEVEMDGVEAVTHLAGNSLSNC